MLSRTVFTTGVIFAILGPAGAAMADGALSKSELRKRIVGKTFSYSGPQGDGTIEIARNGTVTFNDRQWGKASGPWWLDGNKWCRTYERYNDTRCMTFERVGRGRYVSTDGYTFTVQ